LLSTPSTSSISASFILLLLYFSTSPISSFILFLSLSLSFISLFPSFHLQVPLLYFPSSTLLPSGFLALLPSLTFLLFLLPHLFLFLSFFPLILSNSAIVLSECKSDKTNALQHIPQTLYNASSEIVRRKLDVSEEHIASICRVEE
jgi:hypothetical protein